MLDFSIVITSFNRVNLLQRALKSALEQQYENYEILVIDDASNEDYESQIKQLNNNRVLYIRNTVNQGVSESRNIGVSHAVSKYIVFLDDDDVLYPHYLQECAMHLKTNPHLDFAWCGKRNRLYIGEKREYKEEIFVYTGDESPSCHSIPMLHYWSNNLGFMVKRETFLHIGGYDKTIDLAEDIDLLLRLLAQGARYKPIEKVLIDVYIDDQVASLSRQSKAKKTADNYEKLLWKNREFLSQKKDAWQHYMRSLLFALYRAGEKAKARKVLCQLCYKMPKVFFIVILRAIRYELKRKA